MNVSRLVFIILQIASAGCFIGHGAFGVITKKDWLRFFAIVSIPEDVSWRLMPIIGTMDILMGLAVLVFPLPALLLWMVIWAVWTAACRPLSGLSIWEFFERAGNYGAPLALLMLAGVQGGWWKRLQVPKEVSPRVTLILRWATALLLIGHGGFYAFVGKPGLITHWGSVGVTLGPQHLLYVGLIEYALAAAALFAKNPLVFAMIVFWKVSNELLYPISGSPWWEFVERFGSYGVPMALYVICTWEQKLLINAPSGSGSLPPVAKA